MHLVPFDYDVRWKGFEAAAGFAASAVTCRKIAETSLTWDVPLGDVALGEYPTEELPLSETPPHLIVP
jgi:hypothetical protein